MKVLLFGEDGYCSWPTVGGETVTDDRAIPAR